MILGGLSMGWAMAEEQLPCPMGPDNATIRFLVVNRDIIPAIDSGDVIRVDLDRPVDAGDPIPYMHFVGRITDLDAETVKQGVVVTLIAIGLQVNLNATVDFAGAEFYPGVPGTLNPTTIDQVGVTAVHNHSDAQFAVNDPPDYTIPVVPSGEYSLVDGLNILAMTAITTDTFGVLRAAYDPDLSSLAWTVPLPGSGDTAPQTFYVQPWNRALPAPLTLIESPGGHSVILGPSLDVVQQITTLDAALVEAGTKWRKDRTGLVNTIDVTARFIQGGTPDTIVDDQHTYRDSTSVDKFGEIKRSIDVFRADGVGTVSALFYGNLAGVSAWKVPDLVVRPKVMDDDELDELAPTFYPHVLPLESVAGRFFILTNVAPKWALNGPDSAVQIVGCQFQISNGDLVIAPSFVPVQDAEFATSIRWADLGADPVISDTQWGVGGLPSAHYISTSLQWDELTYSDL
jgi:hypothetical protein